MDYAIIQFYDLNSDVVWMLPAHPNYDHGYATLWLVAGIPRPPATYPYSWPKWAAEESVVKLEEVEDVIETYGYNRAFWRVWRFLEWLPLVIAAEEAHFVRYAGKLALLYRVKWKDFLDWYPVYLTYTSKPFAVTAKGGERP